MFSGFWLVIFVGPNALNAGACGNSAQWLLALQLFDMAQEFTRFVAFFQPTFGQSGRGEWGNPMVVNSASASSRKPPRPQA